ncbi:MAG: S41 family peptidase [Tannerellaceae bacterium]|jgi:carboxyl-terminal processing protease|nr:S41 family peptidase [Tannerellaceae bacterium]
MNKEGDWERQGRWWLPAVISVALVIGVAMGKYLGGTGTGGMAPGMESSKIPALLQIIDQQYVDPVDIDSLSQAAFTHILSQLDPHSVYIDPKDVRMATDDLEGSFSGIGVSFNIQTDTILIISVIPGGPAEKAGLLPFDRIITINDSVFSGHKPSQGDIMRNLRGEKGSRVRLGIRRASSDSLLHFQLTRGEVPVHSVEVAFAVTPEIGYLKISKFARTTYTEFLTDLAKLQQEGCTAFIIDLRGNSGGYMDAAIKLVNEFLPRGHLILYTQGKACPRNEAYSNGTGSCPHSPLAVLTDESSASASEIFAGAIQDNDRGVIVGRRTFGKGLVQAPIALSDGSEIRLTIARYYTPSGRSIQKEYTPGHTQAYEQELYNRFLHGEFDSSDSIHQDQTIVFHTLSGRPVYGGGGIMPDLFIPRDTAHFSSYYLDLINTGTLYLYVLDYSDRHHAQLAAFDSPDSLYQHLLTQPLLQELVDFAASRGIRPRNALIRLSAPLIENQVHAYIIRNFFDDRGFYPILLKDDPTLLRAIEALQSGSPLLPHVAP